MAFGKLYHLCESSNGTHSQGCSEYWRSDTLNTTIIISHDSLIELLLLLKNLFTYIEILSAFSARNKGANHVLMRALEYTHTYTSCTKRKEYRKEKNHKNVLGITRGCVVHGFYFFLPDYFLKFLQKVKGHFLK